MLSIYRLSKTCNPLLTCCCNSLATIMVLFFSFISSDNKITMFCQVACQQHLQNPISFYPLDPRCGHIKVKTSRTNLQAKLTFQKAINVLDSSIFINTKYLLLNSLCYLPLDLNCL